MPLAAGTRLGPYEIVGPLGAGGMGEVYRARDAKLGRDVAVKVLPEAFARDPDRRSRFEREARTLAALSHPNILAIFDFGMEGHVAYAVTELLDGQSLRDRLTEGALPVRKAVEVAAQTLRGLAAAHDRGIVHRDLKPENVFFLKDGQVKVLDFGLARQTAESSAASETVAVTDPGTVLGTMGYIAPEQLRGKTADARSDLFAFGAMFYEMLSGRRAFQRESPAETMSAILKEEPPDLVQSRPDFSPVLDRIVRHCLEKNPDERFQSARDVAFALEDLSGSSSSMYPAMVERPARRWPVALGVATLIVAVAAAGYVAGRRTGGSGSAATLRFETKTFEPQMIYNARFAPDGQTLVYSSALEGTTPELFVIRPESALPQRVGRPGMHLLSVSSKGELAVLIDATRDGMRLFSGTLARMTMDGEPRPWVERVRGADWSPDGATVAVVRAAARDRLEYPVGAVLYESAGYISDPRVSPDGTRVAFLDHKVRFDDGGWVRIVDRNKQVTTLAGEYWGEEGLAWSADGRTVYFSAGLVGGMENYHPLAVTVAAKPAPRDALSSVGAVIMLDVARDGRWLVVRQDSQASIRALVPGAAAEREFPWLNNANWPSFSRDGKLLAFTDESQSAGPNYAVAMRRTSDNSPAIRLGEGFSGGISPDGRWALGESSDPPRLTAYPTGTGEPIVLDHGAIARYSSRVSWYPDSRRALACGNEAGKPVRCYEHALGGGPPKPVSPDGATTGRISPDGQRIIAKFADQVRVWPLSGGDPKVVPGASPADTWVGWTSDSRGFIVQSPGLPARLERVDLATGARTAIRSIEPPDRSGLQFFVVTSVLEDGKYYAYQYEKRLSTLFAVTGLR